MRYRAVVDTAGHTFDDRELAALAQEALGAPVLVLFAEQVAEVAGSGHGTGKVTVIFETDHPLDGDWACVPSFASGKLACFGLVPAAEGAATVEEVA